MTAGLSFCSCARSALQVSTFFIALFLTNLCFGQSHELVFIKYTSKEIDVAKIFDSLKTPLFIYQDRVYSLNPECQTRNLGGTSNDRNAGGAANDRNNAGASNERNSGGAANDRNAGGSSNDRNSGGNANERSNGGAANDRNNGGAANDRNTGGASNDRSKGGAANNRSAGGTANDRNNGGVVGNFTCARTQKDELIIYFHNIKIDKTARIYYNGKYYTSKDNYFKINKI